MIIVNFVIVLGILIFVHELGHFLVAKLMGVKIEKFSLGFGPKLIGYKWGETEYLISAFPLGGYVKMFGEGGFSETEMIEKNYELESPESKSAEEYGLSEEDKARSFAHKPVWQRMAIVFAGPAFNMIFAWILLITLYFSGIPVMKATIGEVFKDKPASRAGLQKGDIITSVNGKKILQWDDFSAVVGGGKGDVNLIVLRNGNPLSMTITPQLSEAKSIFGESIRKPVIGVSPSYELETKSFGLSDAIRLGNDKTLEVTRLTVQSIGKLFQGVVPLKTVGGPMMIADMANKAAQMGGATFFMLLAVVSINLGVLNLLPIPVLDGGHILFYIIEIIVRRPVPNKVREYSQQVGMALLLCLMVLAFYNDIMRYFIAK